MKHIVIGAACAAVCLLSGSSGAWGNTLATASQGKRYMCTAREALAEYRKAQEESAGEGSFAVPLEAGEALTEATFPEFHARWLRPLFAVGTDGTVTQVGEYGPNGKPRRLAPSPAGGKPATAEQCWASLAGETAFVVPAKIIRPCTFCDGERWVVYFPEEVAETRAFQAKYHGAHDGRKQKKLGMDEGELKEQAALVKRAPTHGWEGHLHVEPYASFCSYGNCWWNAHKLLACCWTKVHEGSLKRWRHPCPLCKGKKQIVAIGFRRYRVDK